MVDPADPASPSVFGLLRVAAASPELRVADVAFNVARTIDAMRAAAGRGARIVAFPELGLTGYTCGDLFYQARLIEAARAALAEVARASADIGIAALVGLPMDSDDRLYNCAAFVAGGRVLGVVPKQHLPNRSEFYEDRWFTRADRPGPRSMRIDGSDVPFGPDLLFTAADQPGCVVGVEICEDLWAVEPPSGRLALAGATLLLNPSASTEVLGKSEYRRELVRQQSARALAAYVYAGSGPGESTMDVIFGGHSLITENGALLAETARFEFTTQIACADVDLQRLQHERWNNSSFAADGPPAAAHRRIAFTALPATPPAAPQTELLRPLPRLPFVPSDAAERARHCEEIFSLQATGLAKRVRHTGVKSLVIGISGGLDSTLALLVAIRAFDRVGLPHPGITAVTMPGFGTTARTRQNALGLMQALGVTVREIPIAAAVRGHFQDIGHDEQRHDITYENAQARERTQILMDVANQTGGFVVGTGDLSEAALGWMTFNGDHMSMYHVNAGVPKTLVRYLIEWTAESLFSGPVGAILRDIADTPITPELLPLDAQGGLQQKTEDTVGPYALHDFFLFHVLRYGSPPAKVRYLAGRAFAGLYPDAVIVKWLRVFYARFFAQQFKRSSMPDGPKVGSVALSPRGDWRMPSDASAAAWLAELADGH